MYHCTACHCCTLAGAGGSWQMRQHGKEKSSKTVLYTGSVFEYIRARRFQTLAQGQSRMTIFAQGDATMHELGDDCYSPASPGTLLLANHFFSVSIALSGSIGSAVRHSEHSSTLLCSLRGILMYPERVGTALILQPCGGIAVAQNGLVPPGRRIGQCCADVLPKLLCCAHWRLGASLGRLGA